MTYEFCLCVCQINTKETIGSNWMQNQRNGQAADRTYNRCLSALSWLRAAVQSLRFHSNPMLKRSFASMPSNEARLRANTQNLTEHADLQGGQAEVARRVPACAAGSAA
jgi:hypothetical protein